MSPARAGGFSLVEVLAALGVFAVVTLGIVPLLGAALQGTSLSRTETVAQNTSRQMMERIQGLKWFTSWTAKPAKVDLLDLFFPSATGPGYTTVANPPGYPPLFIPGTSAGIYTTTCPDSANPACGGITLPAGYTMTVKTAFVKPRAGTTPQTYEIVTPLPSYAYNGASGADQPPAQLVDVNVVINWSVNDRPRSFQLRSLIGEHHFSAPGAVTTTSSPSPGAPAAPGTTKLRATANVDYVYRVQTGFSSSTAQTGCPTPPCTSDMTGVIGNGMSTIQAGDTATADSSVKTADISIVRSYTPPQVPPATPLPDLATLQGVTKTVHAPPTAPASSVCLPAGGCTAQTTIAHPDLGTTATAMLSGTRINTISADVPNGNPTTTASWQLQMGSICTIDQWFWNPQADIAAAGYLRLDNVAPTRAMYHQESGSAGCPEKAAGSSSTTATPLTPSANRAVTATATANHSFFSMLKFNFSNDQPVFQFSDFNSAVACKATPNGGAYATAAWDAKLTYRFDPTNNNNIPNPIFGAQITMSDTGMDTIAAKFDGVNITTKTMPDAFEWLKDPANNPLVYDGSTASADIYLMNDPANSKKGYLDNLTANRDPVTSVSADGRTVTASIDGAIRIDTNQLSATVPETAFNLAVGKLSCEAVDNR